MCQLKNLVPYLTHVIAQSQSIQPWLQTASPPPPDRERTESNPAKAIAEIKKLPVMRR